MSETQAFQPVAVCPKCGGLDGEHALTCEVEYDKIRASRGELEEREVAITLRVLVAKESSDKELVGWVAQHLKDRLEIPENPTKYADYFYIIGAKLWIR